MQGVAGGERDRAALGRGWLTVGLGLADSPGTPANAEPTRLGFLLAPAATTAVPAVARPTLPTLPSSKLRAPYVSQLLGEVAQISLVLGDCSAIRWGLFKQQQQQRLQPQKTVRARDPTRFFNNVFMAQDVLELHDSLCGLVESEEWPEEKEDAITTVVRLSKHLRPDLTDSQPPDAAGRVVVEQVSMRRAFWSKAGLRGFPLLAVAASRLLGVHATSAASERNWSAWGRLFTSARTRLTLERAKMLIYIKANAGLGACQSNEAQLLARMGE
ncbi:hypothetical protein QJQ45_001960 [Haematococcus lacustris]|nr:hypothetical protein QJQ45_001960 [Haematococcus lacustris]